MGHSDLADNIMIPDLTLSRCLAVFLRQWDNGTMGHSDLTDNIMIPDLALSLCPSVSLSRCLAVSLCPSVPLSLCLSVSLSLCPSDPFYHYHKKNRSLPIGKLRNS